MCPTCGAANAADARFCNACGTRLSGAAPGPVSLEGPAREERKVVTALFCDLVGFTSASESADPEDVVAMLARYFAVVRSAVERHGGVVEKFIGDAVLGVFGVPAAHEDDATRAVRAGLEIAERAASLTSMEGVPLRLRVGLNTGEVLVRVGVAPDSGEQFVAGDTINTASRIQSVAPEMGVAVGEATRRASRRAVEYLELPSATLKGKAEPVRIFQAVRLFKGASHQGMREDGSYVGRAGELRRIEVALARAVAERRPTVVLVAGEPGIGKSRMVAEARRRMAERPDAGGTTWRIGHCLPYGEGITFWALGEVVKGHAGILEGDDAAATRARLTAALAGDPERDWLLERLGPLVGLEGRGGSSRAESFAAWRRFLTGLASDGPAVIVLEDLHWAGDAFLDFVETVVDSDADAPLVVLATTRPELLARRPLLRDHARLDRIVLAPLTGEETDALITSIAADLPADARRQVRERANGNPLFAEEFVRFLDEAGADRDATDGSPLPDSIQGILAARIDALPPDRKAMLADASVIGATFWAGAVSALGGRSRSDVAAAMEELAALEFVRTSPASTMAGETEFAFWHALTRDVAYAQLTRASRADRHLAATDWIEGHASDRVEDVAELLAHHAGTALDLLEALHDDRAPAVRRKVARFARLAGDRATSLDAQAAVHWYARAVELMDPGDDDFGDAVDRLAGAEYEAGDFTHAARDRERAVGAFAERGDVRRQALAMIGLASAQNYVAGADVTLNDQAVTLLEQLGPSEDLVDALIFLVPRRTFAGRPAEGIEIADRAIAMASELGLPEPAAAYNWRGVARADSGDIGGLDDLRHAVELGRAQPVGPRQLMDQFNLMAYELNINGVGSTEMAEQAMATARLKGFGGIERFFLAVLAEIDARTGRLEPCADRLRAGIAAALAAGDTVAASEMRCALAVTHLTIGDLALAVSEVDELAVVADWRGSGRLFAAATALVRATAGDTDRARDLLARLVDEDAPGSPGFEIEFAVPAAVLIGDLALARRINALPGVPFPLLGAQRTYGEACIAEADGDDERAIALFEDTVARFAALRSPRDEVPALLGIGRCMHRLGRADAARVPLERARAMAAEMGARPWLAEADALLA